MSDKENHNSFTFKGERSIERFVGIEYFSNSEIEKIDGIYKDRFRDFIVKEIPELGKVLEIREDHKNYSFSKENDDRYTTFHLTKVNRDTFAAIQLLCRALGIHPSMISYSGLKDKTSISVQKMSIKGNYVEALKKIRIRDIFIRNIYPSKKPVKLGSHWGNNFEITVRKIPERVDLKKDIDNLFSKLTKHGFPNYYGLQRFGTFRPNSHLVGRYLMEKNYKKAFNEFVITLYPMESEQSMKVRTYLKETQDYEGAHDAFPNSLHYEKDMIKYMIDHPEDYKGSFNVLTADLKRLLISSFQSFIFNRMISLRDKNDISLLSPSKGDGICILDQANGSPTQVKYIYGSNYDKWLRMAIEKDRAAIVAPIIGYDIDMDDFPLMKEFFYHVIEEEKIPEEIFSNQILYDLDLKGTLRTIMVKPLGLKMLELGDDEVYSGFKKIKFEFSLPKGSYATMLLRELIK